MVRNSIAYGASLLIATLLIAGTALASPVALYEGEGGGEAEGQAEGAYYVDASGALDKADESEDDLHDEASSTAHQANDAYEQTKADAWERANQTERPETPECECDELVGELEQSGNAELQHADALEKQADVETELVDAGADLSAAAQAHAWARDVFKGVGDAFKNVQDLMGFETTADEDAKAVAEQAIHADDELRGEAMAAIDEDRELPDVNPQADGSFAAEHATEATSSAAGQAEGQIP